jgi:hypothetical protein
MNLLRFFSDVVFVPLLADRVPDLLIAIFALDSKICYPLEFA